MTLKTFAVRVLFLSLALAATGGCVSLEEKRKVDYKTTKTLPPLEVPPDLPAAPGGELAAKSTAPVSATYSELAAEQKLKPTDPTQSAVLPQFSDAKILRDEQTRWMVVKGAPDDVWPKVREFVLTVGMVVAKENSQIGTLETDWAENRAKIGTAGQKVLAEWLKTFYSTGTQDKFRFRLERGTAPDTTEIYVTHQGMEEVLIKDFAGDAYGTRWQPRPSEPDLEIEMLRLLMVHLGAAQEKQKVEVANAVEKGAPRAKLVRGDQGSNLTLQDDLDRAWRRVGLSLDRLGFTVEDRDRSKAVYYVRYLDPDLNKKNDGWFSGWFGSDKEKPKDQYQIQLKSQGGETQVAVLDPAGATDASKVSDRILGLLYEQLK